MVLDTRCMNCGMQNHYHQEKCGCGWFNSFKEGISHGIDQISKVNDYLKEKKYATQILNYATNNPVGRKIFDYAESYAPEIVGGVHEGLNFLSKHGYGNSVRAGPNNKIGVYFH